MLLERGMEPECYSAGSTSCCCRASGHTNYCIEAFNLFVQYCYTLSPRQAEQMLWGRFVNNEGKYDKTFLVMFTSEHLNRMIKDATQIIWVLTRHLKQY